MLQNGFMRFDRGFLKDLHCYYQVEGCGLGLGVGLKGY